MKLTKLIGSGHRHRVLCVDDDELSLLLNAAILRSEGYEAVICSDLMRAALIAKSQELDLAIFDYEMPRMNRAQLAALCSGSVTIPSNDALLADRLVQKSDGVEALFDTIECLLTREKGSPACGSARHHSSPR